MEILVDDKPFALLEYKKSSRTFIYDVNMNGDKYTPCLTHTVQNNGSEYKAFETTLDWILYIVLQILQVYSPFTYVLHPPLSMNILQMFT